MGGFRNDPALVADGVQSYFLAQLSPHNCRAIYTVKMTKQPFDIDHALLQIEKAIAIYPKAAMFALYDEGFTTVFEQLIACIVSIRTRDEASLPMARELLTLANTPVALLELSEEQIDAVIAGSTYHRRKAQQILAIAQQIVAEFDGELPSEREVLLAFNGVGPKCANLALGVARKAEVISVDIHVHRVTNRWGYVATRRPEKTLVALEEKLPRRHWVDINRLLVPFGKHICVGNRPKCSQCPILAMCQQIDVENPR